MKQKELIKGEWYRFYPYNDDKAWYFKFEKENSSSEYIDHSGKYFPNKGNFSDYSGFKGGYHKVTEEEINQLLPEGKKLLKKTYEIF